MPSNTITVRSIPMQDDWKERMWFIQYYFSTGDWNNVIRYAKVAGHQAHISITCYPEEYKQCAFGCGRWAERIAAIGKIIAYAHKKLDNVDR